MNRTLSQRQIIGYSAFLILLGAGWAFTQPMSKIAVSEGYKHFGLIFWQSVIGAVVMAVVSMIRRRGLPMGQNHLRLYLIIAVIGTLLPNSASYQAAVHLPAGVLSILLSMVPIFAFPIALALGNDRFEWRRFGGLLVGFIGVLLIVLPGASLAGSPSGFWVLIGLIAGLFYAFEGNYVAKWGTAGLDPIQVLWGASLVGVIISLPLAILSGQWINPLPPYSAPDYALIASSVIHVLVYSGYVWLVGRAGPVFAVQVSYLVTIFGVFWARVLLGESYAPQIWIALCVMLAGMYLVQPKRT
ncbi:EamA family transporter [Pseudosulfitobacter sp. SM2401]|uniref:DMT family transporter n=1 Tax=Pseudosulfitobacter sp. SM2401 TaxID=3350098 RepID=UPI0036F36D03